MKLSALSTLLLLLNACYSTYAGTLRDVILNRPELSNFKDALEVVNLLDNLLDEPGNYTVFAPNNNAMSTSGHMLLYLKGKDENPARWYYNLEYALENHIVPGSAQTVTDIFTSQQIQLQSMRDVLTISQWASRIEGAIVITPDLQAENGMLHIVDKVLTPALFEESFAKVDLQEEFGPDWLNRTSLINVTNFTNAFPILATVRDSGTTFIGCRTRAFNRMGLDYLTQTINGGVDVLHGELLNASFKEQTNYEFFEYSLLPKNWYFDEIPNGFENLTVPINNCSHMWITKRDDVLCFNNGCVVATPDTRTYLASNGVGYVIDKCQVCPGVAMMVGYAAVYTSHSLHDAAQFLVASEWNLRNLSLSVGDGRPVTLFASISSGWSFFNMEDLTRLASDKWKRHQWDLLKHWMTQGVHTREDLRTRYEENKGPYNITMLTGQNMTIDYDESRDMVIAADGDLYFGGIRGVDGMVHFTTQVPLPRSMTETVYDVATHYPNFTTHVLMIDSVKLRQDIMRLSPLTAMYAPNQAWANLKIDAKDLSATVLENHIFDDLMWCDTLRSLDGTSIDSLNGETWQISVNNESFPCFNTYESKSGVENKVCITKCDILARNGIVHELDGIMLYELPETQGPQPPVAPTYIPPIPPSSYSGQRPTLSSSTDNYNPAYSPNDIPEGQGQTSDGTDYSKALPFLLVAFAVFL